MKLVMKSLYAVHISSIIRPLLLQLPIPSIPNTPSYDALSLPPLALKLSRMMRLSVLATVAIVDLRSWLILGIITVCHSWNTGTD